MAVRKRVWLNTPWHNYADRKKILIDKNNYQDFVMYEEENTHFNHGDTINSSCITITGVTLINKRPNYLIIFNGVEIESRWYAMNWQFMSGEPAGGKNKWNVTLYRDIVIDRRADIAEADNVKTIRGMLPDVWSPLMSNPESVTTNDILQREIELNDKFGKVDWYTIYYDANNPISLSASLNEPPIMPYTWNQLSAAFTFNDGASLQQTNGNITTVFGKNRRIRKITGFTVKFNAESDKLSGTVTANYFFEPENALLSGISLNYVTLQLNGSASSGQKGGFEQAAHSFFNDLLSGVYSQAGKALITATDNRMEYVDAAIEKYNNKYINIENNATFFTVATPPGKTLTTTNDITNGLFNSAIIGRDVTYIYEKYPIKTVRIYNGFATNYTVYEEVFQAQGNRVTQNITLQLPQGNVMDEVVIGCVTLPMSEGLTLSSSAGTTLKISRETIRRLLTGGVTAAAGRDNIYAIEKLPYCPIPALADYYDTSTKTLTIPAGAAIAGLIQPMRDSEGVDVWWGFRVQTASSEFFIDLPADEILQPANNLKRAYMTNSVKLSSPNHTAQMVINPVANNGISRIHVQATLRPNGTYYRWQPQFGGIHGFSTKDDRGIIQEAGLSITIVTNQYIEFTRTNSMYREIFNTEIQYMEANNNLSRLSEQMGANHSYNQSIRAADHNEKMALISGGVGAAGSAVGMAGSLASGNPLAVAGSAVGMAASAAKLAQAGMQADYAREMAGFDLQQAQRQIGINDGLRANSIAQKSILFDLDIATVKNRPNTISQTTALNINNRGCAYLQIFSCTAQERNNIDVFLKMQGMNINQFGSINDYLIGDMCYIEAMLMFLEGGTPVELNAINAELTRGVYVQDGLFAGGI